jgi:hypothetical protein
MNQYYIVRTKCGHVGRNNYILIDFPIQASSKKEAAIIARKLPRVKHHHKDAIIEVREVDQQDFINQKKELKLNPYINSKNIQEQKLNYPDYYDERIEENKQVHKPKKLSVPIRLLKQLLAVSDSNQKEYNELKRSNIWQNRRFTQN